MTLIVAGLVGSVALVLLLAWVLYWAWLRGGEGWNQ